MTENTIQAEEIRRAARQQYGQIARSFDGAVPGCCGPTSCCTDIEPNADLETIEKEPTATNRVDRDHRKPIIMIQFWQTGCG